jgi:hypothetical protein
VAQYAPLFAHLFTMRERDMLEMTYDSWIRHKKFADDWLTSGGGGGGV